MSGSPSGFMDYLQHSTNELKNFIGWKMIASGKTLRIGCNLKVRAWSAISDQCQSLCCPYVLIDHSSYHSSIKVWNKAIIWSFPSYLINPFGNKAAYIVGSRGVTQLGG